MICRFWNASDATSSPMMYKSLQHMVDLMVKIVATSAKIHISRGSETGHFFLVVVDMRSCKDHLQV